MQPGLSYMIYGLSTYLMSNIASLLFQKYLGSLLTMCKIFATADLYKQIFSKPA